MLREIYGPRIKVVFIGPASRKARSRLPDLRERVSAVLTFDRTERMAHREAHRIRRKRSGSPHDEESHAEILSVPGGINPDIAPSVRNNYTCMSADGIEPCTE
jgi:hypothetical protein